MRALVHSRTAFFGSIAAAIVSAIGFATISLGAAIVGETRRVDSAPQRAEDIEAMKAAYRRPEMTSSTSDRSPLARQRT